MITDMVYVMKKVKTQKVYLEKKGK